MGQPSYVKHNYLCKKKQTRGTETSKYLEENKTKVIPKVEAIELGIAQTMNVSAFVGL